MYKRFRDALASPRALVQYRKDKLLRVFGYIFIFALLMGTRSVIDVVTYDGTTYAYQEEMRESFGEVNGDCLITNATLSCDEEEAYLVYETLSMSFYLDGYQDFDQTRYGDSQYAVVAHEETVRFIFRGVVLYESPLRDLSAEFVEFDFALQESDPDAFYDQLFAGVDDYLTKTKWTWGIGLIMADIIMGLLVFVFFVVVNSFFMRRRFLMLKFKEVFVMTVYASTALFVVLIFDSMFQFSFFITMLLIFIAFRQNSQLNDELVRRVMHHQAMMSKARNKSLEDETFDEEEEKEEQEDHLKDDDENSHQ